MSTRGAQILTGVAGALRDQATAMSMRGQIRTGAVGGSRDQAAGMSADPLAIEARLVRLIGVQVGRFVSRRARGVRLTGGVRPYGMRRAPGTASAGRNVRRQNVRDAGWSWC